MRVLREFMVKDDPYKEEDEMAKMRDEAIRQLKVTKWQKFKEVRNYILLGFILIFDIAVIILLVTFRSYVFDFDIDYSSSISLGAMIGKFVGIILIIAFNIRYINTTSKYWRMYTFSKLELKEDGSDNIKRFGNTKKLMFRLKVDKARSYLDKYNDTILKIEKKIGKIKGNETDALKKLKREVIMSILLWKEDFLITKLGSKELVTEEYLRMLTLDDLYEYYLVKCVNQADRFINGKEVEEIEAII